MSQTSASPRSVEGMPSPAHIWLVLIQPMESLPQGYHLQIPLTMIESFAVPRSRSKFLRFIGYCVVGVKGHLKRELTQEQGAGTVRLLNVNDADELVDQGVYHFFTPSGEGIIADSFVDLDVVVRKHTLSYTTTATRDPHLEMQTPNPILDMDDISRRVERGMVRYGTSYPTQCRYTFKYMTNEMEEDQFSVFYPDNIDATFVQSNKDTLPSGPLLDYVFGATAVVEWGCHDLTDTFNNLGYQPYHPTAAPHSFGLTTTRHDHSATRQKRDMLTPQPEEEGGSVAGEEVDGLDFVMFLRINTGAAKRRREEEDSALRSRISAWASDVE
ncbi:hypothetical protein FISHEDRAFT_79039 [Fistulina hepatica ATCC 64428]|uniref:Uncharacterized protein n=1 Tax=Fistulina hepatica ATCC 64428 TaxID=1128425 RepID=A0A0D7A1V0_9AGAR|nr:hypothetical protein FISHEDRAFT_79039 [Fistulina hepatica ATCC 64428]